VWRAFGSHWRSWECAVLFALGIVRSLVTNALAADYAGMGSFLCWICEK
jgi:hypothetical protein